MKLVSNIYKCIDDEIVELLCLPYNLISILYTTQKVKG